MTQVNLPNRNITGDNLWSQVEDNDDAIADVVNGNIDNGNIATNADINASKLLAGSVTDTQLGTDAVTTAKIDAGAVTAAEIAAQAVVSGKLKVATFFNSATTSATGNNITIVQEADVTPGIYLAVGELRSTSVTLTAIGFATSGGTATVTEGDRPGVAASGRATAYALIEVSATTTVQFVLERFGTTGNITGAISLFGIAAS